MRLHAKRAALNPHLVTKRVHACTGLIHDSQEYRLRSDVSPKRKAKQYLQEDTQDSQRVPVCKNGLVKLVA